MVDMSIAFETIDTNEILPEKLKFYGADDSTIDFFKSFFCKRSHFTEWKGENSEKVKLFDYSIVQGSALGPPIFNFYTMDLDNVSEKNKLSKIESTSCMFSDLATFAPPSPLLKR